MTIILKLTPEEKRKLRLAAKKSGKNESAFAKTILFSVVGFDETAHLLSSRKNAAHLKESITQLNRGEVFSVEI